MNHQSTASSSEVLPLKEIMDKGRGYYEAIRDTVSMDMDATYKKTIGIVASQQIGQVIDFLSSNGIQLSVIRNEVTAVSIPNPTRTKEETTTSNFNQGNDFATGQGDFVRGRALQEPAVIHSDPVPKAMPGLGGSREVEDAEGFQPVRPRKSVHRKQECSSTDKHIDARGYAPTMTHAKVRLLLSNLEPTITKSAIEAHFSKYGPVGYVKVYHNIIDGADGRFVKGFVEFASDKTAEGALAAPRHALGERIIHVEPTGKRQVKKFNVHLKGLPRYLDDDEVIRAIKRNYGVQIQGLSRDREPPAHEPAEAWVGTESEAKLLLKLGCLEVEDARVEVDPAWEAKK